MASLLNWAKRELDTVYHGVNPFDHGQGWTTQAPPRPAPRPAPRPLMTNNSPVSFGGMQVQRPNIPLRDSGPDPIAQALHTAIVKPITDIPHNLASGPVVQLPKLGVAKLTGNQRAATNAGNNLKQFVKDVSPPPLQRDKAGRPTLKLSPDQVKYYTGVVAGTEGGARPPQIKTADVITKSPTEILHKIDPRLSQLVHQRREVGETNAAIDKSKLKITDTLKPDEQVNLARVLKGTEKPANDTVKAAARETRRVLSSIYYRAKNIGVSVRPFRKNYYPQILNPKTYTEGSKHFDSAIEHLIRTKQAKTEAEAIGLLRKYKQGKTIGPYGNLSKARSLDLPGYAESNAAIHAYIDRAHASIAHTKVMGKDDAILNRVLAQVKKNGGDYEQAIKSYREASVLERGGARGQKASQVATNYQGYTKLGLSALGNIQQQTNNIIIGGVRPFIKAIRTGRKADSKAFIKKTGVTSEQVAHEALFGEQGVSKFRNVTAPLFEKTEKGNRATGALMGRDVANNLAKKAANGDAKAIERLRQEFGITKPKFTKRGLTQAEQIKAGRSFVERSQFRTGLQDIPAWASRPGGRVVTQFKRYSYKQAQFYKREVIDAARKGNWQPLIRTVLIGAPVGITANQITDKIRHYVGKEVGVPEKVLNFISDATGANLVTSLGQQLYPNSYDSNSYTVKAAKALGGPTASDGIKLLQAGYDVVKKHDPKNAERFGLQQIPVVGTPASNYLLPYGGSNKTGQSVSTPNLDPTSPQAKADSKTQTEEFKKNMPKDGYALTRLPNGRYIYSVNGQVRTTTSIEAAGNAIRKDSFSKSGQSYKFIPNINGGIVLRKSNTGKVSTQSKIVFDHDLNKATLTMYKNQGDLGGYLKTANAQLQNINKQLQDPKTDPLDAIKLQNEAATLKKNINKYAGYGGFVKGRSARGGGGGGSRKASFNTTGLKTASQSKAPKPPQGIKVRKVAVASPLKTKKLSVSKIPKVS